MAEQLIISIGREYGSAGHKIAEKVAKELDLEFYDRKRLDELAEMNLLGEPLQEMVDHDYSLYGIDEVLAFSILNVYGSIGFTNYGYIDKLKPGILGEIDKKGKAEGCCQTFMDDLVGAIAAAAASRIAHRRQV